MSDMRGWIEELEEAGELIRIKRPVDIRTEMGALIWESRDKALLFENIVGYPGWRTLAQAPGTMRQVGLWFGVPATKAVEEYSRQLLGGPTRCEVVGGGPVKEVKWLGEDVDLLRIPINQCWAQDGGAYIGAGLNIVRDPDSGVRNMAYHRHMVMGGRRVGCQMRTETHQWRIYQKYESRGEAMPVAIVIGHDPSLYFTGSWSGDIDVDELELAATLYRNKYGKCLELVKCETIDLEVPADAEIVIEGEMPPGVREMEGPFGEFQGYFTAAMGMNPVINVKAITMRRDAIYKTLLNFRREGDLMVQFNMSARCLGRLRELAGGLDIHTVHVSGDLITVIIQMTQRFRGDAKFALIGALSGPYLHHKIAIAVDEDVDIYDPEDVLWAISTRVNPQRDVFIIPDVRGHTYDQSLVEIGEPGRANWQAIGSRMGIDATKPSLMNDAEERKKFERTRPIGFGKVFLKDFIE
ncbi:TPA: UbiD family decarboxylase [Candidatus Poribacteria bacterium]|nr:UbiD family decarboxylase [Candidatus Poribacteria bacterium]